MNYILLPSLQHAAASRTASLLYNHCEIRNLIRNEADYRRQREMIEKKVDEELSSRLTSFVRKRVSEVVHHMQNEVQMWKKDHEFLLERIGGCCCTHLCWSMDGTINRTRTSKNIVANENINPEIRFIMACTYFLEAEVADLWEKYEEIALAEDNTSMAVRFWVERLKQKDTGHWREMIDEYFRNHRSSPGDIHMRVSSFYHLLSRESKQHIDLRDNDKVHIDDFRNCVNKMTEKERIEVLRSEAKTALINCVIWPFRSLFTKMAKEVIDYVTVTQFMSLLFLMLSVYSIEGDDDYFHIIETFWQTSPALLKDEIRKDNYIIMVIFKFIENETISENAKKFLLKCLR